MTVLAFFLNNSVQKPLGEVNQGRCVQGRGGGGGGLEPGVSTEGGGVLMSWHRMLEHEQVITHMERGWLQPSMGCQSLSRVRKSPSGR